MTKTLHYSQGLCDHALLLDSECTDWRYFVDQILMSGYGLFVFHRQQWPFLTEIDHSDGNLGTPDSDAAEYWALYHCGASRHTYCLIPLRSTPNEWSSDRTWKVVSNKYDVTCSYYDLTRLEADVLAGEHCHWPMALADVVAD